MKHPPWITLATIAYGCLALGELAYAWQYSPLDHFNWIPLLIWLVPAWRWTEEVSKNQSRLLVLSMVVLFASFIASINAVKQLGLALAIAALPRVNKATLLWVCTAISWMSAFTWMFARLAPDAGIYTLILVRIILAFWGSCVMWRHGNASNE